mmetsp:Transcript_10500/g.29879  ORF Transcript_10500/g.29879 Transcript_10500/m.29879 type:complete len:443 (-) Transcript_10500:300-1628(-)
MPVGTSWTQEEDERLRELVEQYGPKRWSLISQTLKSKGSKQCRRRWKNYLNADIKKGSWSPEEDAILLKGHAKYGNRWTEIAKMVQGRTDNAVKNRWMAITKKNGGDMKIPLDDDGDDDDDDGGDDAVAVSNHKQGGEAAPAHGHGTRNASKHHHHMVPKQEPPGQHRVADSDSDISTPRRGPRPGLNVCIPQAAGDAPGGGVAGGQSGDPGPLSIRVGNWLDPTELALVNEVNEMGMPLSILVEDRATIPIAGSQQRNTPGGPGAYKQAQEAMNSPAPEQFNIDDLLKYFTGTPTPKQALHTSRFKQHGGAQLPSANQPPTPGALLDPHRQLLHKLLQKGMTPKGGATNNHRIGDARSSGTPQPSALSTVGVRAAADELSLDEVSEAVDVLLSPSFNDDDLSMLLEALEGGDGAAGGFHTGFTPRGGTGFTPRNPKRQRMG